MTDFATTIAGVRLAFPVMNAPGAWPGARDLRELSRSPIGALVLRTVTAHPFMHPQFRTLHNPGFDKLLPLVRELVAEGEKPVVASIAGGTVDELAFLATAFADAGAALVQMDLAEEWVAATVAPFDEPDTLAGVVSRVTAASTVPVAVRLPLRPGLPYRVVGKVVSASGGRVVVLENEFLGLEKFELEAPEGLEVIAIGRIRSGYDVTRALAKGACAVQAGPEGMAEGAGFFVRLEREMRLARGERPAG